MVIIMEGTSPNTAYTLRAIALALRDIAPFGRNVVYAGNVKRKCLIILRIMFFVKRDSYGEGIC
ncbi:MAG: hypothetical protein J7K81_09895, partial [Methanophagales archaeon]|nr:hypothetical protein [Methanophagales archaeon]